MQAERVPGREKLDAVALELYGLAIAEFGELALLAEPLAHQRTGRFRTEDPIVRREVVAVRV